MPSPTATASPTRASTSASRAYAQARNDQDVVQGGRRSAWRGGPAGRDRRLTPTSAPTLLRSQGVLCAGATRPRPVDPEQTFETAQAALDNQFVWPDEQVDGEPRHRAGRNRAWPSGWAPTRKKARATMSNFHLRKVTSSYLQASAASPRHLCQHSAHDSKNKIGVEKGQTTGERLATARPTAASSSLAACIGTVLDNSASRCRSATRCAARHRRWRSTSTSTWSGGRATSCTATTWTTMCTRATTRRRAATTSCRAAPARTPTPRPTPSSGAGGDGHEARGHAGARHLPSLPCALVSLL